MTSEVVKRGRGRPKGSKSKNKLLSGATVATICEYHKFNPTSFLVAVANGTEDTEAWNKDDRLRAAGKLHDSIHNGKALNGGNQDESSDGQYEIVFIEASESFTLPGTPDTESTPPNVPEVSVQRISYSP